MKTFEVNLYGPYYGVKLAAHYMALNKSLHGGANGKGGRIVITASALTPSNLAPAGLLESYPKEALTKMETLMKAFDALGRFDKVETEGWGGQEPNGQVVEGRGDDIHYKNEIEKTNGREVPKGESCVIVFGFDRC
jgi:15-hydroxyprostaglandin dehydrogenase (NAD)